MKNRYADRNSNKQPLSISVNIPRVVLSRIKNTVLTSNVEEGGKFLGKITSNHTSVHIEVDTFIDSGPKVNKSSSHIIPDGEYQEAVYRVVESFDPDIEHIGTWHSHHCNGLAELSSGDVQGYFENVNHRHYNSKFFFVMLVTSAKSSIIERKLFLFTKGVSGFLELNSKQEISITQSQYFLEPILQQVEKASMMTTQTSSAELAQKNINRFVGKVNPITTKHTKPTMVISDDDVEKLMKTILIEDNSWFKSNFIGVKTTRIIKTNSFSWVWEENVGKVKLTLRYEHLPCTKKPMYASLEFSYNDKTQHKEKIEINSLRFQIIQQRYLKMKDKISKKSGMATYNKLGRYDN